MLPAPPRKTNSSDNKEDCVDAEIIYFAPLHGQGNEVCDSKKQQCGNGHKERDEATSSFSSLHIFKKEIHQQPSKHDFHQR